MFSDMVSFVVPILTQNNQRRSDKLGQSRSDI